MKELTVFNFEQNEVRTLQVNNEPWFVLSDVCKVLELSNPSKVSQRLDEDERSNFKLGRQGKATIINESGLYAVILRSDKPQARQFRKWITSEVLPTLRKTGEYKVRQSAEHKARLAEARQRNARSREANMWLKLADRVTVDTYRQILICKSAEALSGGEQILPLPKTYTTTYTAAQIGEMLGISANMVGKLANRHGLKNDTYGEYVWDKSPYSAHQCQTFRYYLSVIPELKKAIEVA